MHVNHLFNLFHQALINIFSAKLRSFLAVLGILVGTAAVVALMSSGRLATEKALQEFKLLGTDLLSITVFPKSEKGSSLDQQEDLPLAFWQEIPQKIAGIRAIAPYAMAYQAIAYQGKVIQGTIIAADETLANILNIKLAEGRFVSFVDSFEHFCVIGKNIADQIQGLHHKGSSYGKQVQIGKNVYTIVGIARQWTENAFFNDDINLSIIVPLKGLALVNADTKINNVIMLLKPDSDFEAIIEKIKQEIEKKAPSLSVFARSPKQIIASMESQSETFTWLLSVIGCVSLLVGGIGIMNIMLVSVSERRKEIGLRKAIGAKDSDIQSLFLMEALILSLLGGILGVFLGIVVTASIAYFSHWSFQIYWLPPIAGFAVSIMTGLCSGYYPASRAAKVEAVVSLRSE